MPGAVGLANYFSGVPERSS